MCHVVTGNYEQAEKDFLESISLEPIKEGNGAGWLARACYKKKEYDKVLKYANLQLEKGISSRNALFSRGCVYLVLLIICVDDFDC